MLTMYQLNFMIVKRAAPQVGKYLLIQVNAETTLVLLHRLRIRLPSQHLRLES